MDLSIKKGFLSLLVKEAFFNQVIPYAA